MTARYKLSDAHGHRSRLTTDVNNDIINDDETLFPGPSAYQARQVLKAIEKLEEVK